MRNYEHLDKHITHLIGDIYEQPEDVGHTQDANSIIDKWMASLPDCKSVLDVGCGTGFCQPMFEKWGVSYTGVALGIDVITAFNLGRNVKRMDFNFLEFEDNSFDMIFSRHSMEHSFSPLLSLMEWHRVAKNWLGLVIPAPEHYGYKGRNHYYVFNMEQIENLLEQSGWRAIWKSNKVRSSEDSTPMEYRLFCEKIKRVEYK